MGYKPNKISKICKKKSYRATKRDSRHWEHQRVKKKFKRNTFELFRRNIANPEIPTFDELYECAKFIEENTVTLIKFLLLSLMIMDKAISAAPTT